jgi:hypothetical protein
VPEANPLVREAITEWGLVWGLVYWKLIACVLLLAIFVLQQERRTLTMHALAFTAAVYGTVFFRRAMRRAAGVLRI